MESILDLTRVPAEHQYEAIAGALGALPSKGGIGVVTTGVPQAALRKLIAEKWGTFDWTPLSEEGGQWRQLLRRRDAAPSSLTDFMAEDHERCDTLYATLEEEVQGGMDTLQRFREFETAMRRHFAMEEEGFFPQFERLTGMERQGPTAMMREEHTQMRGLLDRMSMAAAEGDADGLLSAGETLLMMIQQHNMKEEQMLYPMADEVLGNEVEDILKKLILY